MPGRGRVKRSGPGTPSDCSTALSPFFTSSYQGRLLVRRQELATGGVVEIAVIDVNKVKCSSSKGSFTSPGPTEFGPVFLMIKLRWSTHMNQHSVSPRPRSPTRYTVPRSCVCYIALQEVARGGVRYHYRVKIQIVVARHCLKLR